MAEFTIVERTEPVTLDEVFSFIDETNISKRDAHELKSRIANAVRGIREKAIDEFAGMLEFSLMNNYRHLLKIDADEFEWLTTDAVLTHIRKVKEQLKEVRNEN